MAPSDVWKSAASEWGRRARTPDGNCTFPNSRRKRGQGACTPLQGEKIAPCGPKSGTQHALFFQPVSDRVGSRRTCGNWGKKVLTSSSARRRFYLRCPPRRPGLIEKKTRERMHRRGRSSVENPSRPSSLVGEALDKKGEETKRCWENAGRAEGGEEELELRRLLGHSLPIWKRKSDQEGSAIAIRRDTRLNKKAGIGFTVDP